MPECIYHVMVCIMTSMAMMQAFFIWEMYPLHI